MVSSIGNARPASVRYFPEKIRGNDGWKCDYGRNNNWHKPFNSLCSFIPPRDTSSTFHNSSNTFFIGKCGQDPLQNFVTILRSLTANNSSLMGWASEIIDDQKKQWRIYSRVTQWMFFFYRFQLETLLEFSWIRHCPLLGRSGRLQRSCKIPTELHEDPSYLQDWQLIFLWQYLLLHCFCTQKFVFNK